MAENRKELVGRYRRLQRQAFRNLRDVAFRYLLFSDVASKCEAMCRFGEDYRILLKVARG